MTTELTLPDYSGPNLCGIVPHLLSPVGGIGSDEPSFPDWFPPSIASAEQVCLLILDGVGWDQLTARSDVAPTLSGFRGGPITSVAPTTTATALASISTGLTPGEHGLVGYRMAIAGEVLNVLRWSVDGADRSRQLPPADVQRVPAFMGERTRVHSPAELGSTPFSSAHLNGADHVGYRSPSSLPIDIAATMRDGARFAYAYYGGVDRIAHERGFGEHYDAELALADRLVAQTVERLPRGAALLVTADHGQVDVGDRIVYPSRDVLALVAKQSGEGRFRWLHARRGAERDLLQAARESFAATAWVYSRQELIDLGVFGGPLSPQVERRMGDVALLARDDVSYFDPCDTGPFELVCRHGSLTPAEVYVPLLASEVIS